MSIDTETSGHVLLVVINRQEAMNALDPKTNDELREVWLRFEKDRELRVAVLTGAGNKAFSAGADIKTMLPDFRQRVLQKEENPVWAIGGGLARGLDIRKPIVAAVNGHCHAGGLEMALACDVRFCSPNASFSLSEAKLAVPPGAGGTQLLPRAIPLSLAMEMLLTGDPIDAQTALRAGLVSRILETGELVSHAMSIAKTIASRGPLAVQEIRRLVRIGLNEGLERGLDEEHKSFQELLKTNDAKEGYTAFSEKRPPLYHGS